MTLYEAVQLGAERLSFADNPVAEAELMLAFAASCTRLHIRTHGEELLSGSAEAEYKRCIDLRSRDYPAAYITGRREFYGLGLAVAPGVLIPRQETELLVEKAAMLLKNKPAACVCDMGTGSGAIAVALAECLPQCRITACDISDEALRQAEINARNNGFAGRIDFVKTDYFGSLEGISFDAILSNPPYIPSGVIDTLEDCVKKYEPRLALDGGEDGLTAYRIIFGEAETHLKPGGFVLCEIGWDQGRSVPEIAESNGFAAQTFRDYAGLDRMVYAEKQK